ncbi:MAG: putative monovalent cation/H+ antiporter subunit A [Desulfuromonadales bacterium]
MLWTVLSGFFLAFISPLVARWAPRRAGWLLGCVPLALAVYYFAQVSGVAAGGTVLQSFPWLPAAGISLSFYLDGLSLIFALLVTGVGALIYVYAGSYLAGHRDLGRFYLFLSLFMAAMLGLVLAGNLITLFIFWELTSFASYFLIGFEYREETSRRAALQALLVTGIGGLALFAGFLLLGGAAGSFELVEVLGQGEAVRADSLYPAILVLVLAGAFTKSAQVPFHFWLPSAMAAPTPVSAYLHSVTMVKAGVYLLFRLSPVLGGTVSWQTALVIFGGATMVTGVVMAVVQTDLKRILAYTTVSSLGTLVFLIGLGVPLALEAALVYLVAHAFYKGALFLVAGAVDHGTGTRDLKQLGGLFRTMPVIGTAAVLAALSMAGVPPLFGFLGKELFYDAVMSAPRGAVSLSSIAFLANLLMVAAAGLLGLRPFFGRSPDGMSEPHGTPVALALGPILLAGFGLAAGLLPWLVDSSLLSPALQAVSPGADPVHLSLWHGLNPVLALSVLTLLAGAGFYSVIGKVRTLAGRLPPLSRVGPDQGYDQVLRGLNLLARWQTRMLQNGRLRIYLLTIVITTIGLTGFTLASRAAIQLAPSYIPLLPRDVVIGAMILAAAGVAVRTGSRLTAIVAMGVVGFGIALVYVQFGAPDVAMTQFIIETMTVVLFVLVFHRLPLFSRMVSKKGRQMDTLVALGAGGMMTMLTLVVLTERHGSRVAGFFAEQSWPAAHGRNLVNIILVDFRATDTLGEITVLALAGIGILALLNLGPAKGKKE